jgi:SAM-dependent methyltransferase
MPPDSTARRRSIQAHWEAGRPAQALAEAWDAYADGGDRAVKVQLASLLSKHPEAATPERERDLHRLLNDGDIDPSYVAPSGWMVLLSGGDLILAAHDPEIMAQKLEASAFARDLLKASVVTSLDVELPLTRLRRWLLLSGRWTEFPRTTEALIAQAVLNCGAWLFDDEERAGVGGEFARAYRPKRLEAGANAVFEEPVTGAVAAQYEGWPYPVWTRVMRPRPGRLCDMVKAVDPHGPDTIPLAADVLIAGCGTGHEAALAALQCPDAKIMAIDISRASLRYAAMRCAEAGIGNVEFRALDLHRVGDLDRRFDVIGCSGVLHHLADPEKGWAALADVLKPGGAMKVMLYSKHARERFAASRALIADLADTPVDDDVLREVRRRLIGARQVPKSRDFFTLPGVYDLLLHRHEDSFDIPRIENALKSLGLELLAFQLPNPRHDVQYRAINPGDPLKRDFKAWEALESRNPALFGGMYEFWCRKPAT